MNKFLVLLIIVFGGYLWHMQHRPGFTGEAHNRVIMYSLTTCSFCDQKRRDLTLAAIPFTEYYVDKELSRREELTAKLKKAGFSGASYGTPTFDMHGYMLLNNPSMEKIREHMALGQKKS